MQDNKDETLTLTLTRDEGRSVLSSLTSDLEDDDHHYSWTYIRDIARLIEKLEAPLEKLRLDEKRRDLEEEIAKLQVRV